MFEEDLGRSPLCLTIPGLGNSGPGHWQTIWEAERGDCERIELGLWDDPNRNVWMSRIDQAVSAAPAPVVLVAHSLGCLALAWWASFVGDAAAHRVKGALLVAPPDVDQAGICHRLARFAPAPKMALPFRAMLVASRDDPYASIERSAEMAGNWGCTFVDAGAIGHINAASGLAAWRDGQALLDRLIDTPSPVRPLDLPPPPSAWPHRLMR
ncbi:RBBP9/YdeN family alpha/beta hydrolase [Sphingomonas nostoxanthinifaciens]|uniref:RBBP9/YdeN family alpha/beta hydrolase n=1 Tax=Sphingomonas nostoxanthinifaciens TaxID=2872652 RepID=UPI001CC1EEBA|nr:alpha/beta hydrolase [Sphingomonas nostoxanthinifaciens]UAK23972.1 alpha/beta hydrolase [Sphingomonas nostoxanthinifaciens]